MYLCKSLHTTTDGLQTCFEWVVYNSVLNDLAITKAQMVMLATPIIGIYGLIIAFALFNNFSKRA